MLAATETKEIVILVWIPRIGVQIPSPTPNVEERKGVHFHQDILCKMSRRHSICYIIRYGLQLNAITLMVNLLITFIDLLHAC